MLTSKGHILAKLCKVYLFLFCKSKALCGTQVDVKKGRFAGTFARSVAIPTLSTTAQRETMIDFHSHILPSMDDGSSSVEESIEMLRISYCGGTEKMAAIPHSYAQKEAPERFLERHEKAWEQLEPLLLEDIPIVYLGAEMCYYAGMSNTECLSQLCMEHSKLLLLEMPFQ